MKQLDWVMERISSGLQFIATLMLIGIVIVNIVNVVGRYGFSQPLETAEELMIFMLTIAVFFCFPRCTKDDEHIRMDLIRGRASGRVRKVWDLLLELVHFGVTLVVIYLGVPTVAKLFAWGQVSSATNIPMWLVHSVVPFGFGLASVILFLKIVQLIRNWGRS